MSLAEKIKDMDLIFEKKNNAEIELSAKTQGR